MGIEALNVPASKIFQAPLFSAKSMLNQNGKAGDKTSGSPIWTNYVDRDKHRLLQENREIIALYNLSLALDICSSLDEIIQTLYKESSRLLDTTNFAIVLYDPDNDTLNFALVFIQGYPVKRFSVKLTHNSGLTGRVLTNQIPLLIPNLMETDYTDEIYQLCPDRPIRSWLGVPILNPALSNESIWGVLVTWRYEPNALTDHELWLLSAIATQVAINIRKVHLVLTAQERMIKAEKQARENLARDLHDGPTQLISSIKMRLDFCKLLLTKEPARLLQEIDQTQELAEQAVQEVRTLLFELRPLILETHGLVDALQIFIERRQVAVEGKTKLTLKIETTQPNGKISRQDEKVEAILFAIIREAVNNALKHAQAHNITVQLKETAAAIYAIISDNGVGFDPDKIMSNYERRDSLGMINIRERTALINGELSLKSAPAQGTQITIKVPKTYEDRLNKRGKAGQLSPPYLA